MNSTLNNPVTKRDHILGNSGATLTLLEYGDYQCSSCGESYLEVNHVIQELGKKIVFVFRNFPLTAIHPDAFNAALAAEAAALQNNYWAMYNLLFQNQEYLGGAALFSYARIIGLDMKRFGQDVQSQKLMSKIELEMEDGIDNGVSGTPSFFINGEKFDGDWENGGLVSYLKQLMKSEA